MIVTVPPVSPVAPMGNRLQILVLLMVLAAFNSPADGLSDGRALVDKLLAQHPTENYAATGTLEIRDGNGRKTELPVKFETRVTATNWSTAYEASVGTNQVDRLYIVHAAGHADEYFYRTNYEVGGIPVLGHLFSRHPLTDQETMTDFAGSDFWIADLGLEFLHWPQQKFLKKEIKRSQGCSVLESTNPHPTAGGYARVVSWIDSENGGLVQAKAYDAGNQLLKEFYPKDVKKVNGQWQVGMMEMDNDQTDSRSRLEFDPAPADSPQK